MRTTTTTTITTDSTTARQAALDRYNGLARQYKTALLSGDKARADELFTALYTDKGLRSLLLRYKKTDLSDDDYLDTIFTEIFLSESRMLRWQDERYSIVSYLKMLCQSKALIGQAELSQTSLMRPDYMEAGETRRITVVSSSTPLTGDTSTTLEEMLADDSTSLEDAVLGIGNLNDASEVSTIISNAMNLGYFDQLVLVMSREYKADPEERVSALHDLCTSLHVDETIDTQEDVARVLSRIRKRILRGSRTMAATSLRHIGLLSREAV